MPPQMICVFLLVFPFVCSAKTIEKDLLTLETAYNAKPVHEPMIYYKPSVPYNSYEQPQLEYIPHPYPAHETPKSKYMSNYYKNGPKGMPYPPESPYMKPYSSAPMQPPYQYSPEPRKPYDSNKPLNPTDAPLPIPTQPSEYVKYKPSKKMYKMIHSPPEPHPSIMYPIDDYYQYSPKKPEQYPYPSPSPKQTYSYPYQPEYQSYSSTKAYPPQTYSDYPKQSYNYSPPPPPPSNPSSYYSYEPKPEYMKTPYEEPYYSSHNYRQKY